MAIKFQYNKTSLGELGKQLKMRQKALPTIKSKESALRSEVKKAKDTAQDFQRQLDALTAQYGKLLGVDNIDLQFTEDAIEEIATISEDMNATSEDIGARRLHTVMEYLLEDISFNAGGDYPTVTVKIDKKYVDEHLDKMIRDRDLKKYVL